jgi:hypothetical protein
MDFGSAMEGYSDFGLGNASAFLPRLNRTASSRPRICSKSDAFALGCPALMVLLSVESSGFTATTPLEGGESNGTKESEW